MTSDLIIPPAFILLVTGMALPFTRGFLRTALLLIAPVLALGAVWSIADGSAISVSYLGYNLNPVEGSKLSRLFGTVFALMASAGGIFAINQKSRIELGAAYAYAGAALGAVFAGDLISLFIFWELMAVASTLVIWSNGSSGRAAGFRYAIMHFLGGAVLMAGIAGEAAATGSITFTALDLSRVSQWMILVGVLINAAAVPLSAWLSDAYPQSSWSGMVFLSAFTTKTAVYVLIKGFPGADILIWIGLTMVFYGIIFAILENDMRRILAYSIVNQVGFMVAAVGIGTETALNGAAAHAFTHIIYKALLLMSAGSVLYMTGKSKCTDLGGLFRTMPITAICGIIGALAISSFPFTSGFVSKSMISQAAADEHMGIVWFLLMAASAGVFLHAGIKFPWFVFFQKDSGLRPSDPPRNMQIGMIIGAALCILIGIYPAPLYDMLPFKVNYVPYTTSHVVAQLQLLLFSGLAFFLMLGWLKRTLTITLDADWLWRIAGNSVAVALLSVFDRAWAKFLTGRTKAKYQLVRTLQRTNGPLGTFGRTWPTGTMAFWTTVILVVFLLVGSYSNGHP